MKNIVLTLFILLSSALLQAQISFSPEFGVYKLNPNDQLRSLAFLSTDHSGENIYAGYFNRPEHLTRVVKYNFEGTVVENKTFPLSGSEEFINGKVFTSGSRIYFVSITAFTADTVIKYEDMYLQNSTTSSNYLSFKIYDYENPQILDSTRVLIGTNYSVSYIRRSLKLGKLNFINIPFPDREPLNIYIGTRFDRLQYPGVAPQEDWYYTSHLFNVSFDKGKISRTIKLDNCGNDFYLTGNTIISSGYQRSVASSWDEKSVQFILKSDNEYISHDIIYKFIGYEWRGREAGYTNYIKYFEGLFNNFPENSEYSPLSWYSGLDTFNPNWEGPYFILRTKDFSSVRDSVYGAFFPGTMHNVHTYIRLSDSSDALLYFTKDGPIITYWLRRVSDGRLKYFDSYGTMIPDYILRSTSGKQYFFKSETSGLTAYVLNGEVPTGVDETGYDLPGAYELRQNYPNPFNGSTKFIYVITKQSYVELKIFDMLGREVTTLVSDVQQPGEHVVDFESGSLPSGIYIYAVRAGNFQASKKLILLK